MTAANKRHAVILAAGKGTRFNSEKPKVLHEICGKPMISYLLERLESLIIEKILIVVDSDSGMTRKALESYHPEFIIQSEQLGTGHAIMSAADSLKKLEGSLLVLYGDTPFIQPGHLESLLSACENGCDEAILTTLLEDPTGYGRIARDASGAPCDIIEEKEADPQQKLIREINAGFACFKIPQLLSHLDQLSNDNRSGEYYLTDMVKILNAAGKKIEAVQIPAGNEIFGINDRSQLAAAEKQVQKEIALSLMESGVTIKNLDNVLIHASVLVGPDTSIYPGAILEGRCRIGSNCSIGPNVHLIDVEIGDNSKVENGSTIRASKIGSGCHIGPNAHIRDHSEIGDQVRIGNFVEVKNSTIGDQTTAAHLSYLGDARIGSRVTIGAGTITCNFDGENKNQTLIEDLAFIGSDSQLIAPVRIGQGATVAAGSTITEDVPARHLAIARSRQINKKR